MTGQGSEGFGYRHSSDGDIQSWPFTQQLYFILDEPRIAQVTFRLSSDAVCMRPNRASDEQAIIGQVGRPLLYGVNGVYDVNQDLLIEWYGRDWKWLDDQFEVDPETGELLARLEVELGQSSWFVNLRPQYYRTHLGYMYHKPWEFRPTPKPVSGWCSWEAYRRDVSESDVAGAAEFFSKHFKAYGMEYIQIDDGFEKTPIPYDPKGSIANAWLDTNDQFPNGHQAVVGKIRKEGLKAGIWTSASLTNKEFMEEQPECIIKDKDGQCIEGEWLGYLLDCLPDTLDKHIRPYYEGLRKLGYDYFKTDQIRHLLFDGLHKAARMGVLTTDEVQKRFRAFMKCAREGIGADAFFLASWGVLSEVVGIVDACRIAIDANPTWAGVRMQLVESARWYHSHRVLFINDPDHLCVRTKFEWARTLCSLTSLSGSLFMLSDPLDAYDEERIRLIQRCLPPLATMTAETGPLDMRSPAFTWTKLHGFAVKREKPVDVKPTELDDALNMAGRYPTMNNDHPFSTLWAFHLDVPGRNPWSVVGRIATIPLKETEISLENLGLDPEKDYLVFDFWAERYLGRVSGKFHVPGLDLGHCQILSLRQVLSRPQFLASTRHISMDAVSVKSETWADRQLTVELSGIPGTKETYWFHVPLGYVLTEVCADGITASHKQLGEIVSVEVEFTADTGAIKLVF